MALNHLFLFSAHVQKMSSHCENLTATKFFSNHKLSLNFGYFETDV